jgi:hypothetical protein
MKISAKMILSMAMKMKMKMVICENQSKMKSRNGGVMKAYPAKQSRRKLAI